MPPPFAMLYLPRQIDAGLSTEVLPAARAGAIFHAAMMSGKFQGMMPVHTP